MSATSVFPPAPDSGPTFRLTATGFDALDGFAAEDHREVWQVLAASARAIEAGVPALRSARPPSSVLRGLCRILLAGPAPTTSAAARLRLEAGFRPFRVEPLGTDRQGFVTGYYEPRVQGSWQRTAEFQAPVLPRPTGFDHVGAGDAERPGAPRHAIEADAEAGRIPALVWLRDWIEVFLMQVQGSGRVTLPDGSALRLVYDGRNGRPYTSIGRILVDTGRIPGPEMSLDRLKAWVRAQGQAPGEAGRALMWRNESYVFFRAGEAPAGDAADTGPTGGQGVQLTPLRSLAVDRTLWPYGLPFWIEAELPWRTSAPEPFRRLMVAQDTGSAILGPARADLYIGSGEAAGRVAGGLRHPARFWVLLPRADAVS